MNDSKSNGLAIRTEQLARHYTMGSSVIRAVNGIPAQVRLEVGSELLLLATSLQVPKCELRCVVEGLCCRLPQPRWACRGPMSAWR